MEGNQYQKALRTRFLFRLAVLALSIAACVAYLWFHAYRPVVWGVILGLAGSALVWAFVELIDFFVETHVQFVAERNRFFIMVQEYWHQLRQLLRNKKNPTEISWNEVKEVIDNLYAETARFPFDGPVYTLSHEFELAVNYITRLYWKSDGYINAPVKQKDADFWAPLYGDLVWTSAKKAEDLSSVARELSALKTTLSALKDIEVSFEDFHHPDGLMSMDPYGDMGKSITIPAGETTYVTFKPAYDFQNKFHENPPDGTFLTVIKLLFRRLTQW